MERRRLKLHGSDALTPAAWEVVEPRLWLPGRCLAVVDTDQGQAASLWALSLAQAFAGQNHKLPVVLTAFERPPEPMRAFREALEAVSREVLVRAVAPTPGGTQQLLSELEAHAVAESPCWLMVGVPAVLAFESSFQVLVVGEQAPERWLPALRRMRRAFSLEVTANPSPALFPALARALLEG